MNHVYLLLGSNLEKPLDNLKKAVILLNQKTGIQTGLSSIYKTAPWGFEHKDFFFNQVIEIQTELSPLDLLVNILSIEQEMGRKRTGKGYEGRIIDIDILFFNNLCMNDENLTIPHPLLHKRRFTLSPLNELAPEMIHPIFQKKIAELLANCEDKSTVEIQK